MMYNNSRIINEVTKMTSNRVRLSIYITPEEKTELQRLAKANMRSMAGEVRALIVEQLKQEREAGRGNG